MIRGALASFATAVAVLAGAPVAAGSDPILYYVEDGRVVFTNTPDRRDSRPVPGLGSVRLSLPAHLPETAYDPFIRKVAAEEGLDASLIKAVALVESGFNPKAVSPKGARGIMQLMPATARRYGVRDPHDPYQSLRAGAQHLRDLLVEFGGDLTLALAAYNAGAGAVRRHGGVPAYRETREYVSKVTNRMGQTTRRKPVVSPTPPRADRVILERNPDGSIRLTN